MTNFKKLKFYRIINGIRNTFSKPWKYPYIFIYIGLATFLLTKVLSINYVAVHILNTILKYSIITIFILLATLIFINILIRVGTPLGTKKIHNNLYRVRLKNSLGEIPWLISKRKLENRKAMIYIFMNNGISLDQFENRRAELEVALNVKIFDIKYVGDRNKIEITTSINDTYDTINWKNDYLSEKDFVLILGETMKEIISIDISRIPHILIGGSSGSGKSVLLKLLLKQSLRKGAEVYLADFKGGVDFPKVWHDKCKFILSADELIVTLAHIISRLEERKKLLVDSQCTNIQEYNERGGSLNRIIFACDEISQILDKTGLNKEQKELIAKIESHLATISQQGRAFGIHLILATQRPDANILNGQIKANIGYRMCGRADSVLSSIVLDDTSASIMIPKDAQGLFIDQNMTVFQGYWFDDAEL